MENPECPYNTNVSTEKFCTEIGIVKEGCLTYASLLLFGRRSALMRYCSNFWIDYLEIPGTNLSDGVRYAYRMPEQENLWEYYQVLIQRLRLHVQAPFMAGPNGYSIDDNSQLYALREGLINLEAHSDYFSVMHPTIRVFDDRIEFQNPGRIMFPLEELRERLHSVPRNPSIIRLLRHAKLGENAGYGIQRMIRWESLTGQSVKWDSDLMSTTVTYYRPRIGNEINATSKTIPNATSKTIPNTTSKTIPNATSKTIPNTTPKIKHGDSVRSMILKYIRVTPDISQSKLADLCKLSRVGISYHISKLKAEGYIIWEGAPRNGRWLILKN